MSVTVKYHPEGWHHLSAGEPPFELTATVRPVGTIQLPRPVTDLLQGPFSRKYLPDLIELLQKAQEITDRDKPWGPA